MTEKTDIDLTGLDVPGYIKFTIKADDTIENSTVHEAFKEMARIECGNDYTLALRKLLEYYERDAKFASLYDLIADLSVRVSELEALASQTVEQPEEEDGGTF
jgi:hypothetical protein